MTNVVKMNSYSAALVLITSTLAGPLFSSYQMNNKDSMVQLVKKAIITATSARTAHYQPKPGATEKYYHPMDMVVEMDGSLFIAEDARHGVSVNLNDKLINGSPE